MRIYDPLYGSFWVTQEVESLLSTPEVRRLSQVRLLNTVSPSLATLGELRRYSHTLGVLYLSDQCALGGFSAEERKALKASILLHDVGTPPFAHLLEYQLAERTGWSHESVVREVLWGTHAPENRAHQIFAGRPIEFGPVLKRSGISFELVERIVRSEHPLSLLLFGSIDLDNLDNVARMSWALGKMGAGEMAVAVARNLTVTRAGDLVYPEAEERAVKEWAKLRREAYEILVFDSTTVAAQAVLSEAIRSAVRDGLITEEEWSLTDEELLELLRRNEKTKYSIVREYFGRLPELAFQIQVTGTREELALGSIESICKAVETVLRAEFKSQRVLAYVFVDCGTFGKRLRFRGSEGREWEFGSTSASVILYGFVRSVSVVSERRGRSAAASVLELLGVGRDRITREAYGRPRKASHEQKTFDFSP